MTTTIVPKGSTASDPSAPRTPALADADARKLTFVNSKAEITTRVASCKLERTIEGASSITASIHDPKLTFLNSPAIAGRKHSALEDPEASEGLVNSAVLDGPKSGYLKSTVVLDNQVFVLAGIHLTPSHIVEAILEEEAVNRLRQNTKPLVMSRGTVTRAEFIKHMFSESGIELVCPELNKKQPIESTAEAAAKATKGKERKPGFAPHAALTVQGKAADSEQRENIEAAMDVAASHSSGVKASIALLCAIIQESECRNDPSGDGTSKGILQVLASTAAADDLNPMDVHACCAWFLTKGFYGQGGAIQLAKEHPTWKPGEIAQAVQGSAHPDAYQVWAAEAAKMVGEYTGENSEALQANRTYPKEYTFRRGGPQGELEDSWTCARRLVEEVDWYLFIVSDVAHLYSGEYLLSTQPKMLVAPGADGIIGNPEFGYWTTNQFEDSITVNCSAGAWQGEPGTVAEVEGYGPVDGRWIVTAIARENMQSNVAKITLGRPNEKKKEPAHEVGTRTSSEVSGEGTKGTALAAYEASLALSALKIPYPLSDTSGDTGHAPGEIGKEHPAFLDCSASVSYVLYRAGMFNSTTAEVSGELASSFGEPGKGKEMTVWANREHVWIEFMIPGKPHSRLDTVPAPGEEDGPRLRTTFPAPEGTNFTPRHYPGT